MIDFKEMEYGFIKMKDGVVIVMNGTFYGPYKKKQANLIFDIIEQEMSEDEAVAYWRANK